MTDALADQVEEALGQRPIAVEPMTGGCVASVYRLTLSDGDVVVAKHAPTAAHSAAATPVSSTEVSSTKASSNRASSTKSALRVEGGMLTYLGERDWPVPKVRYSSPALLVMDYVEHDGRQSAVGERQAAGLLAGLHSVRQPYFGFEFETVIAGLPQPHAQAERWIPFFAEQRLIAMAVQAQGAGRLDAETRDRVERLAGHLDRWLLEPAHPSLLHGDLWGGNILFHRDRVAALIDPACYWGHAEVELAFTTLFSTFGEDFYTCYQEQQPLAPGFFEVRRDLYNLYPLLVHVTLFGGGYLGSVQRTLTRYGF